MRRIFCVGRNYAEHAREFGNDERDPPFFFTKPADAIVPSGAALTYPSLTQDLHHEAELVVAIGTGGRDIAAKDAASHIFGFACGNDLTRRDFSDISLCFPLRALFTALICVQHARPRLLAEVLYSDTHNRFRHAV